MSLYAMYTTAFYQRVPFEKYPLVINPMKLPQIKRSE